MEPEPHTDLPPCREVIGGPAPRGAVTSDDYLLTYGPLGIMAAIFLAIIAILWRDRNAVRRELHAEMKRREDDCRTERDRQEANTKAAQERYDTSLREMAREANETARAINEKWHDHARELRGTVESATRRMGRRE